MSILNGLDVVKIIHAHTVHQKAIALVSNLEAMMQKVSKSALKDFECASIDELTLSQLGRIYQSGLNKDDGMYGTCWEYGIYNFILYEDDYVQTIINEIINKLTGEVGYSGIDAILWGGEKTNLDTEGIISSLEDDDCIWANEKLYKFKDYIYFIYTSFRVVNDRKKLPNEIDSIWKTDLFVKKKNSNIWFAVTVKWNKRDCRHYTGLSIGIHYENTNTFEKEHEIKVYKDSNGKKYFAMFCVPFEFNFSKYIVDRANFFKIVLTCINSPNKNINIAYFGNPDDYKMFLELYNMKNQRCSYIIKSLKEKLDLNTFTEKENSIILSTKSNIINGVRKMNDSQISLWGIDVTSKEENEIKVSKNIVIMPEMYR